MRATYRIAKVMTDGRLALFERTDRDRDTRRDLWSVVTTRKPWSCAWCGAEHPKGDEAFAPLGNQLYRSERLCPTHGTIEAHRAQNADVAEQARAMRAAMGHRV